MSSLTAGGGYRAIDIRDVVEIAARWRWRDPAGPFAHQLGEQAHEGREDVQGTPDDGCKIDEELHDFSGCRRAARSFVAVCLLDRREASRRRLVAFLVHRPRSATVVSSTDAVPERSTAIRGADAVPTPARVLRGRSAMMGSGWPQEALCPQTASTGNRGRRTARTDGS
jgi:hypothetical protein